MGKTVPQFLKKRTQQNHVTQAPLLDNEDFANFIYWPGSTRLKEPWQRSQQNLEHPNERTVAPSEPGVNG
jgi:hypothetical protein